MPDFDQPDLIRSSIRSTNGSKLISYRGFENKALSLEPVEKPKVMSSRKVVEVSKVETNGAAGDDKLKIDDSAQQFEEINLSDDFKGSMDSVIVRGSIK